MTTQTTPSRWVQFQNGQLVEVAIETGFLRATVSLEGIHGLSLEALLDAACRAITGSEVGLHELDVVPAGPHVCHVSAYVADWDPDGLHASDYVPTTYREIELGSDEWVCAMARQLGQSAELIRAVTLPGLATHSTHGAVVALGDGRQLWVPPPTAAADQKVRLAHVGLTPLVVATAPASDAAGLLALLRASAL